MIHLGTGWHAPPGQTPQGHPAADSWLGIEGRWSVTARREPEKEAWPLSRSAGRLDSDVRSSKDARVRTRLRRLGDREPREYILAPPHRADWSPRTFELSPSANWNRPGITVRLVPVWPGR